MNNEVKEILKNELSKIDRLNLLKIRQEFVGWAGYLELNESISGYREDNKEQYFANYDNLISRLQEAKNRALEMSNMELDKLYLAVDMIGVSNVEFSLAGVRTDGFDDKMDAETLEILWELMAKIAEVTKSYVVERDSLGKCIKMASNARR